MQENARYAPTMAALDGHPMPSAKPSATHGHSNVHTGMPAAMQQQHAAFTGSPSVLTGHVFDRQQRFLTLPHNLQEDTKQFRAYVEQDRTRLFQTHHHVLKSVYSVKGKELIDAIILWLQSRYSPPVTTTGRPVPGLEPNGAAPAPASSIAKTPGSTSAPVPMSAKSVAGMTPEQLECAKQVAEALVLSGFVTPYKDGEKHLNAVAPDHYVNDSELLVPVAPSVAEHTIPSVWSVIDGAVYARNLKRTAGLLGKLSTDGKDVYVVLNGKTKKAYLFKYDLARKPISELSGTTLHVQFDNSHFEFGVRVSLSAHGETNTPELFNAETKSLQEELVNAWLSIGAKYEEGDAKNLVGAHVNHTTHVSLTNDSASHSTTHHTGTAGEALTPPTHHGQAMDARAAPHMNP